MHNQIETRQVAANGLTFTTLESGSGPLALCLHGFPDSAHTWRHLLPALADAGFHAVAPFTRGYAPTEIPADGCFSVGSLIADIDALHEALGGDERAVLIGHDWGAVAAYRAAPFAPGRWRRVVTLAVPPPALDAAAVTDFEQLKRYFYGFMFLAPDAEDIVAAEDLAFVDGLWTEWSPGYDHKVDVDHVRESLGERANLSAALGYYRAYFGVSGTSDRYAAQEKAVGATVPRPTLYLHGERDGCISSQWVESAREHLAPGSRTERVDGVGHFLHLEEPDRVNELIVGWVAGC